MGGLGRRLTHVINVPVSNTLAVPPIFLSFFSSYFYYPDSGFSTLVMTNNTRKLNAGNNPSVRFVSWNIKGIGNPVKRSRIITHLKYLNTILIQILLFCKKHTCTAKTRLYQPVHGEQIFSYLILAQTAEG